MRYTIYHDALPIAEIRNIIATGFQSQAHLRLRHKLITCYLPMIFSFVIKARIRFSLCSFLIFRKYLIGKRVLHRCLSNAINSLSHNKEEKVMFDVIIINFLQAIVPCQGYWKTLNGVATLIMYVLLAADQFKYRLMF